MIRRYTAWVADSVVKYNINKCRPISGLARSPLHTNQAENVISGIWRNLVPRLTSAWSFNSTPHTPHTHTHTRRHDVVSYKNLCSKNCTWISVLLKCVKLKKTGEELLSVWWLQYSRLERRAVSCFYVKVSKQYQHFSILYALPHRSRALFGLHMDARYTSFSLLYAAFHNRVWRNTNILL
jgi:hypothetical protein